MNDDLAMLAKRISDERPPAFVIRRWLERYMENMQRPIFIRRPQDIAIVEIIQASVQNNKKCPNCVEAMRQIEIYRGEPKEIGPACTL